MRLARKTYHFQERTSMNKLLTAAAGVGLVAVTLMPSFATELHARIKSVDANKGTVTVVEGKKDYNLSASASTKFLNVKGAALINGIKSGDLRAGRRVTVNYDAKGDTLSLTSLKIR